MDDDIMFWDNMPMISSDPQNASASDFKPTSSIIDITEKEILHLTLLGSEKIAEIRETYLSELKSILMNAGEAQQPSFVFDHLKKSSRIAHIQVFEEVVSFLFSELKIAVNLKPPVILKALYCLFLNYEVLFEGNASFNIYNLCTTSLKKFLTDSQKSYTLRYLLKDIAADILSELDSIFLSDSDNMLVLQDFCCMQEENEDFYGTAIAWLSNLTSETAAKLVQCAILYNKVFVDRSLNSFKVLNRLVSLCESYVYCCWHSQIVDDTSKERNSLYDLKLVDQLLYNLIRQEAVYTSVYDIKFKPKTLKSFSFSDLLFDEVALKKLLCINGYSYDTHESDEREISHDAHSPEKQTPTPKNLYATESSESYMEDDSFWHYWDVFSHTKTYNYFQRACFGHLCPSQKQIRNIYLCEKTNVFHVSIPSSDCDPFNLQWIGLDTYNPFSLKQTKGSISYMHRKPKNMCRMYRHKSL